MEVLAIAAIAVGEAEEVEVIMVVEEEVPTAAIAEEVVTMVVAEEAPIAVIAEEVDTTIAAAAVIAVVGVITAGTGNSSISLPPLRS